YVTGRTINSYRHREGLKPFHVIPNPLKSENHISDRLWLCEWPEDWTEEDFLHLAPSDEFYVWLVRRPNYQNDRIWAISVEDIEEDERLLWVIKDNGEPWSGEYFRDIILTQNVILFLNDEENVIDPNEATFAHDKTACNSPDLNVPKRIGSIIKDEVEKKMLSETGDNRYREDILKVHLTNVLTNLETDTDLFETLVRSYPSRLRAVKNVNGPHTHY
ncbi:unnamed protein product, partial [Rotaria sp. Silwood2]